MPATRSQEQETQLQAVQQLANETAGALEQLRQNLIVSTANQLTVESLMTLLDKRDQRLTAILRIEPSPPPTSSNPMKSSILGSGPLKPTHTDERPTQRPTPRLIFPRFSSGDPSV
ncbi:hypothetical protein NL676_001662 [Syzygium grande]|nr:hypothetical protein NL676_001662 [Syzygium grande]